MDKATLISLVERQLKVVWPIKVCAQKELHLISVKHLRKALLGSYGYVKYNPSKEKVHIHYFTSSKPSFIIIFYLFYLGEAGSFDSSWWRNPSWGQPCQWPLPSPPQWHKSWVWQLPPTPGSHHWHKPRVGQSRLWLSTRCGWSLSLHSPFYSTFHHILTIFISRCKQLR